jgi:hypothetical protein
MPAGFEQVVQQALSALSPGATTLTKGFFGSPNPIATSIPIQTVFLQNEEGKKYAMCGVTKCGDPDYVCS